MRIHRSTVGDVEIAEVEIPGMTDLEGHNDDFGMHRFTEGVRSASRRSEIIVTRLLVHELFGDDAVLCHEPSGAPFVEKAGQRISMAFSLSHCRGWVVMAWSDTVDRVGIDVELVAPRVARVKERVFNGEELRFVGTSLWKATVAWTAKEALFKCVEEDGVDFQRDLSLDLHSLLDGAPKSRYFAEAYGRRYDMHSFSAGNRILTVTSSNE